MSVLASRVSKPLIRVWFLLAVWLPGPACSVRRSAVSPPANAASNETAQGLASITILTSSRQSSKDGEVVPPRPVGALETPEYPESPLKAKYGAAVVAVRVYLDEKGRVTGIEDAPNSPSTGGRFAADFRASVEDAIHRWVFQPAEYRQYADGKDINGDGKPDYVIVISAKPIPVYFDVRFDFSIVKGRGQVR